VNRTVSGLDLVSIRLDERPAKIEVYMAWRKGEPSTAVHSFLNSARRVLRPSVSKEIA
jgi:hypothetical protein